LKNNGSVGPCGRMIEEEPKNPDQKLS